MADFPLLLAPLTCWTLATAHPLQLWSVPTPLPQAAQVCARILGPDLAVSAGHPAHLRLPRCDLSSRYSHPVMSEATRSEMRTVALCQLKATLMALKDCSNGQFCCPGDPLNISRAATLFPVQTPLSSCLPRWSQRCDGAGRRRAAARFALPPGAVALLPWVSLLCAAYPLRAAGSKLTAPALSSRSVA